jgi:hypothetical protein
MSATAAWGAGWRAFRRSPEQVLVPVLAAGFGWVVAQVLVQSVISATVTRAHPCVRRVDDLIDPTACAADADARTRFMVLTCLAVCFLGHLFWAVALRSAHRTVDPDGVRPLRAITLPVLGTAAVLSVLLTVGVGTGMVLAVVIAFLAQHAMAAVVVEGRGTVAALLLSVREVAARPRHALGFAVIASLTVLGGSALLLVGVWPATALLALAQVIERDGRGTVGPGGVADPPLGTMAR